MAGKVWLFFGFWKGVKFVLLSPVVLVSGSNRAAYEMIAPCELTVERTRRVLVHPDARFVDEIFAKKCYTSQPGFDINPEDTVVDLGANIGIFSLLAGVKAKRGTVIAVEPDPQNYRFLTENLRANGLHNVRTWQGAISAQTGRGELHLGKPGSGSLIGTRDQKRGTKTVDTITLDALFAKFHLTGVDFLKVDIEGAEFQLFENDSWLKLTKRIAMEVHPFAGDPALIIQRLGNGGFNVTTKQAFDPELIYVYGRRS